MGSAVSQLREDMRLGGLRKDPFSVGDVLRWTVNGEYSYAALRTPVGWYTTAMESNMFVRQRYNYLDLVKMLVKREVENLEVSTEWRKIQ